MWKPLRKSTTRPRRISASLRLQPLESRLAPAVTMVNPTTATFTDVDGDKAIVKVSAGTLTPGLFTTAATGLGEQLQTINFGGGGFDGVNLTVMAVKAPTGDGLVNVGYINSNGHDFGAVRVAGDLGRIDAGDGDPEVAALKSLTVRSLGRYGLDTQGGSGYLQSGIAGTLGALVVAGDVKEAHVRVYGNDNDVKIGAITIGGSLIGGSNDDSGQISSDGDMGMVKIRRDVIGGPGYNSGRIISQSSSGKIAGVTIGGSLIGGPGNDSGLIYSEGDLGMVKIGHDVIGGAGERSGRIESVYKLAAVTIGGSLVGGSNDRSGEISEGHIGLVRIGHDVIGGTGANSGRIRSAGNLAGVTIGGSLVGGLGDGSGQISSSVDMGMVRIGQDVRGGPGIASGSIHCLSILGTLAGVHIGGSLFGGSNTDSGQVSSLLNMGPVMIAHDVLGGSGVQSGLIFSAGTLASVNIGGSLIGGSNTDSGVILSGTEMGAVRIRHDFIGGSITGADSLHGSGEIQSYGRIASVSIGGSIISGTDNSAGILTRNASIRAGDNIGSLTVTGSVIGNVTSMGASPVYISARGQAVQGATTDVAIGSIRIGGRVEYANIFAGYNTDLNPVNGDAQIGSVSVSGDWIASNLVAGVMNASGNFGDGNDATIADGSAAIGSRIGNIVIRGLVYGTPDASGADHFGFVAKQIGSFRALGFVAKLTAATNEAVDLARTTGDVTIREVA